MDPNEELPALLPLDILERPHAHEGDEIPALIPIVERRPLLLPPHSQNFSDNSDNMPTLISVSDSSDDGDVSSLHYSSEEYEENEWTDEEEVDEDFEEDLPPLPTHREVPDSSDEESDVFPFSPQYPAGYSNFNPFHSFMSDSSWLPPRRSITPSAGLMPDIILEARANPGILANQPMAPGSEDLDCATMLVDSLERVSGGLLERMLRVGGAPGAYEDVSKEEKGDSGCAICWESLLDQKIPGATPADDGLPFPPGNDHEIDIVCLPCAHVFHSSCLVTWFSHRKTSCPTCRFNIDPDSLTRGPWLPIHTNHLPSATVHRDGLIMNDIYRETIIDNDVSGPDEPSDSDEADAPLFEWATTDSFHPAPPIANQAWTLPDAPGKSLRESIEEKEREMGLRCLDPFCIFAPTDEAPLTAAPSLLRQISIRIPSVTTCMHAIHPACLVRSARASGWTPVTSNTDVCNSDFSAAEVLCPSCLMTGTVSRKDWEEGVMALPMKT